MKLDISDRVFKFGALVAVSALILGLGALRILNDQGLMAATVAVIYAAIDIVRGESDKKESPKEESNNDS